jgi:hypothetical protein
VATGASNAEASRRLHVSLATVKSHLTNAYRKLGASNRVEATRLYLRDVGDPGAATHHPAAAPATARTSSHPGLLPEQIDRHLETLAGVSAETDRLRRHLEALRAAAPSGECPR